MVESYLPSGMRPSRLDDSQGMHTHRKSTDRRGYLIVRRLPPGYFYHVIVWRYVA